MYSCTTPQQNQTNSIIVLNIQQAIKTTPEKQSLSKFATSCAYIPLETKKESVMGNIQNLYLTDEYILAVTFTDCLLFDRGNGKFIRKIGSQGNGPNEYNDVRACAWDEQKQLLYVISNGNANLVCYNLEGEPVLNSPRFNTRQMMNFGLIDSVTYAGNIGNIMGNEKKRLVIGTFGEDSIKIVPNYSFFTLQLEDPQTMWVHTINVEAQFYHFDNKLFFKEYLNDTIFEVQKPNNLIPSYVFNMGSLRFPEQIRGQINQIESQFSNYILHQYSHETTDYLFSSFEYDNKNYAGIYDKKANSLTIIDQQDEKVRLWGLQNDLSGDIPFWPRYIRSNGEMATWYRADQLIEYKEKHKLNILPDLLEEDNPVVVIVKLKQ